MTGTVKWYNEEKGFGFIAIEGGSDVFCHRSALAAGLEAVKEGDSVEFDLKDGKKGPEATNVRVL